MADVNEETLDPQDWRAMRALGHRMVDDAMTYLETIRERPVFPPISERIMANLKEPLPKDPQGAEKTYKDFMDKVVDANQTCNVHPCSWGWVVGSGTLLGALADMWASTLNLLPEFGAQASYHIELQVLDWLKEMLGYPAEASGILVSGDSVANLLCLTVARNTMAGINLRKDGLHECERKMTVYGSKEIHSCIQKDIELLGIGDKYLRRIPVDKDFKIDLKTLEQTIREDRDAGYQPFCIIGNAGTINTGAFDDLITLANICAREKLWFHVDGAFGAWAALVPDLRHLVSGMERADSLAVDLHKWMYMPYGLGCAFIRREMDHRRTFTLVPDYLAQSRKTFWLSDYGIELSRPFRALKAWMLLKEHGALKYGRLIQQNVDQARYLAERVKTSPELELLAPVPLNIVCFRYVAEGLDEKALNELNEKLMYQTWYEGVVQVSNKIIEGKFALSACIVNHRTKRKDLDLLVNEVIRLGRELVKSR